MERFEYTITAHTSESFKEAAYACSDSGECRIPDEQNTFLQTLLNERGQQGWELVQLAFNKNGFTAFWKRKLKKIRRDRNERQDYLAD